MFHQVIVVAKP